MSLWMSLHLRWVSCIQLTDGSWHTIQFASLCLLIGTVSPFTFKVNIVNVWIWSCHFDASWLICLLVVAVSSLCPWYLPFGMFLQWLVLVVPSMFCASFRSLCKTGLVVTKSLSSCLSIKDFISPSLMKLSWLDMKFWVEGCWYWPLLSSGL